MKVLGTGGHANVVIDTVHMNGLRIEALYDDNIELHNKVYKGYPVRHGINESINGEAIIAIGKNEVRKMISKRLKKVSWKSLIHPSAVISEDVVIGEGSIIMAGAVIQPGTKIGNHCIINSAASIDHDCLIGDYCHIAPNCGLAGGVSIDEGSFIGIGSSIIQNIKIGEWSVIGAGSVVINNIPPKSKAVGVPATLK